MADTVEGLGKMVKDLQAKLDNYDELKAKLQMVEAKAKEQIIGQVINGQEKLTISGTANLLPFFYGDVDTDTKMSVLINMAAQLTSTSPYLQANLCNIV